MLEHNGLPFQECLGFPQEAGEEATQGPEEQRQGQRLRGCGASLVFSWQREPWLSQDSTRLPECPLVPSCFCGSLLEAFCTCLFRKWVLGWPSLQLGLPALVQGPSLPPPSQSMVLGDHRTDPDSS